MTLQDKIQHLEVKMKYKTLSNIIDYKQYYNFVINGDNIKIDYYRFIYYILSMITKYLFLFNQIIIYICKGKLLLTLKSKYYTCILHVW